MEEKVNRIALIVFLVFIAMRVINIAMPILEGTAMRQVQTAMIARNFYRDGINILYPRVDHFGGGAGYLILEFPLLNALAALGYMLLGGVHEWVGRLFSILFFSGAAYFLYGVTERLFDRRTALWSLLVFGISPLSIIFSRTFMPDFEMLFFSVGALYFGLEFFMQGRQSRFWFSAIFLSAAMLVKPHSFYIMVPLLYLIWKKEGRGFTLHYKNWAYLAISVLPALLWYLHGLSVHTHFTTEQGFNYQLSNWFDPARLLDVRLYLDILKIYAGILFTPVGLILFISGLFIRTEGNQSLVWPWLLGSVLFLIAFITHAWEPYYHLNILPAASVFIARAITSMQDNQNPFSLLNRKFVKILFITIFIPFWLRYAAYAYIVPKGYRYVPEAGVRIQSLSNKNDLIVVSTSGSLYFCDRKGWGLLLPAITEVDAKKTIEQLEDLRNKGAVYFMATVMSDFDKSPAFKEYMFKNYKVVEHNDGRYIIFSLSKR